MKMFTGGILWRSSGWDSVLSLPRVWFQYLVRKLRLQKLHGAAKKKKKKKKEREKMFSGRDYLVATRRIWDPTVL